MSLLLATVLAAAIDHIHVEEHWRGYGEPADRIYTIARTPAMNQLAVALERSAQSRDQAIAEFADPVWLRSHAGEAFAVQSGPSSCSEDARRLFEDRFSDPGWAMAAIDAQFSGYRFDDHPCAVIEVVFEDGRQLRLVSVSQYPLMLPWTVSCEETWSPEIPRALAEVLPAESLIRQRLSDANLVSWLGLEGPSEWMADVENLEERCKYKDAVAALATEFNVRHLYNSSPETLSAHLGRVDFPRNLVIDVHIEMTSDPAEVAKRLAVVKPRIDAYVTLVREFVMKHPDDEFELWYTNEGSVTEDSLSIGSLDQDEATVAKARGARVKGALLARNTLSGNTRDEWIFTPEGEVILWQDGAKVDADLAAPEPDDH